MGMMSDSKFEKWVSGNCQRFGDRWETLYAGTGGKLFTIEELYAEYISCQSKAILDGVVIDVVADIRNKLSPLFNLAEIIAGIHPDAESGIDVNIIQLANTAKQQFDIITSGLQRIVNLSYDLEKQSALEREAVDIAVTYVDDKTNLEKLQKLGEELVELTWAVSKDDVPNIEEEIGDCAYVLLHLAYRINPNKKFMDFISHAAMKMLQRKGTQNKEL